MLTSAPLPEDPSEFFDVLHTYFPKLIDLKHLTKSVYSGGLQRLAAKYGVARIGTMHQGGSDALMTADTFFALPKDLRGREHFDQGILWGLTKKELTTTEAKAALRNAQDKEKEERWRKAKA